MIPGHATVAGTSSYAARHNAAPGHFRAGLAGLTLASIGLGTYLGEADEVTDAAYGEAIRASLRLGSNVIDTAINYRFQRSERTIGTTLAALVAAGTVAREEVVICTKGGYPSFDGEPPTDPGRWIAETFVEPGIVAAEDFVQSHCMAPAYLVHQIAQSRANLQLDCLDLYYLHNPESQRPVVGDDAFYAKLRLAFETLERAVSDGQIRAFGTATWNAYRVAPQAADYLALQKVLAAAREVGGADHHFRAIQLPCSLAMPEALGHANQPDVGGYRSVLHVAADQGVTVFASASLLQSRLAAGLPAWLAEKIGGLQTDAQRALQFSRSVPGLTTALVGMSQIAHVEENLGLMAVAPLTREEIMSLFRDQE